MPRLGVTRGAIMGNGQRSDRLGDGETIRNASSRSGAAVQRRQRRQRWRRAQRWVRRRSPCAHPLARDIESSPLASQRDQSETMGDELVVQHLPPPAHLMPDVSSMTICDLRIGAHPPAVARAGAQGAPWNW